MALIAGYGTYVVKKEKKILKNETQKCNCQKEEGYQIWLIEIGTLVHILMITIKKDYELALKLIDKDIN